MNMPARRRRSRCSKLTKAWRDIQEEGLRKLRAERSGEEVRRRLDALVHAAEGNTNLMPLLCDAVKAYATLGEICDALRGVFGVYQEIAVT